MNEKIQKLVDAICELTVIEIGEVTKELKDKLGISLDQPAYNSPQAQISTEEIPKEKISFDVWLKDFGLQKINVIKLVRGITGKSLMESKTFVESAPQMIKGGATKVEADDINAKLSEVGAVVEIK